MIPSSLPLFFLNIHEDTNKPGHTLAKCKCSIKHELFHLLLNKCKSKQPNMTCQWPDEWKNEETTLAWRVGWHWPPYREEKSGAAGTALLKVVDVLIQVQWASHLCCLADFFKINWPRDNLCSTNYFLWKCAIKWFLYPWNKHYNQYKIFLLPQGFPYAPWYFIASQANTDLLSVIRHGLVSVLSKRGPPLATCGCWALELWLVGRHSTIRKHTGF